MAGMTFDEAIHHFTTTEPAFELAAVNVRGVDYKVFKNAPANVTEMLRAARPKHGEGANDYLVYLDERWSFDAYCDDVKRMAHVLSSEFGIRSGDRVAIAMRNYPELLILVMASAALGAVTVFLNAWWTTEEFDYALSDCAAKLVFADGPRFERLIPIEDKQKLRLVGVRDGEEQATLRYSALRDGCEIVDWPDLAIAPDDDFAIMYSSGTTGRPKGVVQTHRGAVSAVFSWLMTALMGPLMTPPPADAPTPLPHVFMVVTPLFHVTATHPVFLLSIPAGARLVLLHKWEPVEAARLIAHEQVTRFVGVPTQTADLMDAVKRLDIDLPTLDYLGSGGAKRPVSQVAELARAFPKARIATGWGMTETNGLGIGMLGQDYVDRPDCAGQLYPPLQDLRIIDDAGATLPNGEVGEITVKGPNNMRCYLNKPEATVEVLNDGWLRTGDLGHVDDFGYVTIVDRKKNIIIRGGENIACLDVESALHRHPDVVEAVVFPVPHPRLGEVAGACIQCKQDTQPDADTFKTFLQPHIAAFKIPEHYWFRQTQLTRGATDKTDRRAIARECIAGTYDKQK